MQMPAKRPVPPALVLDLELSNRLARQMQRVQRHEYLALGRLEKVHVEAAGIAHVAGNPLVSNPKRSAGMDWYNTGPGIGWTVDNELVIVGALEPPPPIPDPNHNPTPKYTQPTATQGAFLIEESVRPRLMIQDMAHYADCVVNFAGSEWLVFQPVHSILLLSAKGGFTAITTKPDPQGRSCCLIYEPRSKRAHFLYGAYAIMDHTGAGRQSLAEGSFGGGREGAIASLKVDRQLAQFMDNEKDRQAGKASPAMQGFIDAATAARR